MSRITERRLDEIGQSALTTLGDAQYTPLATELYTALMAERAELNALTARFAELSKTSASRADTARFWQDRTIAVATDALAAIRKLADVMAARDGR